MLPGHGKPLWSSSAYSGLHMSAVRSCLFDPIAATLVHPLLQTAVVEAKTNYESSLMKEADARCNRDESGG